LKIFDLKNLGAGIISVPSLLPKDATLVNITTFFGTVVGSFKF
jgi:hypothetical protein